MLSEATPITNRLEKTSYLSLTYLPHFYVPFLDRSKINKRCGLARKGQGNSLKKAMIFKQNKSVFDIHSYT